MTALEAEYRYLIRRASLEKNTALVQKLIVSAMQHDLDLSDLD